jgi:hypothetical protein
LLRDAGHFAAQLGVFVAQQEKTTSALVNSPP